jgi:hypothetical protein
MRWYTYRGQRATSCAIRICCSSHLDDDKMR